MQKAHGGLAVRFLQILFVKKLDVAVFMGGAERFALVDGVERVHTRLDPVVFQEVDRLPPSCDTAAGTGHDFDEMEIAPSGFQLLQQRTHVADAVGDRDSELQAADPDFGFLDPSMPRS